jgi:hypothetical protein
MPEDVTTVDPVQTEPKQDDHPGLAHLGADDKTMVLRLRKENAERRTKNKELPSQIDDINAKISKEQEAKLVEDGKLKELLEKKEQELAELQGIKETNDEYEQTFKEQLEAAKKKLKPELVQLLNEESGLTIAKKLKWANQLMKENLARTASPDSKRPGGDAVEEDIKLSEYSGTEGRKKLVALKSSNPTKYQLILDLKNK